MARSKIASGISFPAPESREGNRRGLANLKAAVAIKDAGIHGVPGLRERKKVRLRQEIIKTAVKLFRKRGYENTRVDDIVQILEISQPTFFRYFPSKDAVLREVGLRAFACIEERLESELSSEATTAERLRRMYQRMAREVELDRPLWRAVVLSGAMDPVRTPDMRWCCWSHWAANSNSSLFHRMSAPACRCGCPMAWSSVRSWNFWP